MAMAAPFVMAAGAAVSAISAIQQGKAAKAAAKFNAKVAEQNAAIALEDADYQARVKDRETYLRLGAIRAAQGHAGGAAGEGSVLDILSEAAAMGEEEKQRILYAGQLRARGFENTAELEEFSGKTAMTGAYLKAGSELLSGGFKAYDAYKRLNRTG